MIALKPLNQGLQAKKGILRHFKQIFKALDVLLMQVLSMPLGGPIVFAAAAADGFTWAHSFFRQMLPMPSDRPITFAEAAADGFT